MNQQQANAWRKRAAELERASLETFLDRVLVGSPHDVELKAIVLQFFDEGRIAFNSITEEVIRRR